ncbi:BNR repeat-containing protein [Flavobacterium cellulosilyticum]|uniref:BNR repeat-containing protein n=1 Tax=Flavobacterium cellulosilyticum TaxID=2541731 RepID=UPI001FEC0405|nr:BNR repeat-containing protein [Flavobacterium cellulosilyticum]
MQTNVGYGWSNNSVNTVKFRKNALTTFKQFQFTAYYDENGFLILGKRKSNSKNWKTVQTAYKGNSSDAHNTISIAIDGDGYLHVSWDHHNTKLRYAKGAAPLSLELGEEQAMTGIEEQKVTYPEFYNLPNGNLLFFYRSGASGKGNMVIDSYDVKSKKWVQLQQNLLDGEEQRSAYWQSCIDDKGVIHLSWVWRESWDVYTNHDLCYARSKDGGITWEKSTGTKYTLPITAATAEYAWKIPQKSSLINQTAMTADKNGNPYIVSYWSENEIPQFQIVYLNNGNWKKENTGFRKTAFYLGGGGTKQIPISRPDIFIDDKGKQTTLYLLFRDEERGNKISLAYKNLNEIFNWNITDLTPNSIGQWEPNYDLNLWKTDRKLNIFSQEVTQIDGEGVAKLQPTMIRIVELKNLPK